VSQNNRNLIILCALVLLVCFGAFKFGDSITGKLVLPIPTIGIKDITYHTSFKSGIYESKKPVVVVEYCNIGDKTINSGKIIIGVNTTTKFYSKTRTIDKDQHWDRISPRQCESILIYPAEIGFVDEEPITAGLMQPNIRPPLWEEPNWQPSNEIYYRNTIYTKIVYSSPIECFDPDKGFDPSTLSVNGGVETYKRFNLWDVDRPEGKVVIFDNCKDENTLREVYCNANERIAYAEFVCPCIGNEEKGICKCDDSDVTGDYPFGKNPLDFGAVSGIVYDKDKDTYSYETGVTDGCARIEGSLVIGMESCASKDKPYTCYVTEKYCNTYTPTIRSTQTRVSTELIQCNTICKNGKCMDCEDSDGINYFVKGITDGVVDGYLRNDFCMLDTENKGLYAASSKQVTSCNGPDCYLIEYYCPDNYWSNPGQRVFVSTNCPNGCTDGICAGTPQCVNDIDCGTGFICTGGLCEEGTPECVNDIDCGSGYNCIGGVCVEFGGECTTDAECGIDYYESAYCSGEDRYHNYHDFDCLSDNTCSEDINPVYIETCDDDCVNGVCVSVECQVNDDCDSDEVCIENVCEPDVMECTIASDCATGEICISNICIDDGLECIYDGDCSTGDVCVSNICEDCYDDYDCPGGYECVANDCEVEYSTQGGSSGSGSSSYINTFCDQVRASRVCDSYPPDPTYNDLCTQDMCGICPADSKYCCAWDANLGCYEAGKGVISYNYYFECPAYGECGAIYEGLSVRAPCTCIAADKSLCANAPPLYTTERKVSCATSQEKESTAEYVRKPGFFETHRTLKIISVIAGVGILSGLAIWFVKRNFLISKPNLPVLKPIKGPQGGLIK